VYGGSLAQLVQWVWEHMPGYLAVLSRLSGLFVTAPVLSSRFLPVRVRVPLLLVLAAVLYPAVGDLQSTPWPWQGSLLAVYGSELLWGATMGFVANLVFIAVYVAGQIIDMEMGFGIVNVVDPVAGIQAPVVGNFLFILALMLLLLGDGHHVVLGALWSSYRWVPVGAASIGEPVVTGVLRCFGRTFVAGIQLALPVAGALFLTTLALGIVTRTVPQANVFVVGLPVKIGVGMVMLAAALPVYRLVMGGLFRAMYGDLSALVRMMGR